MGGAEGWNTLYRDIGCSLVALCTLTLFVPVHLDFWWVYLVVFALHWVMFSTYWDWLFGYDNFWFSGLMVGIAMFPAIILNPNPFFIFALIFRAFFLAWMWYWLNKYLPNQILIWRKDVAEEFLRYASSQ